MNIKCEKCGFINEAEPESKCSNCGEYLYQFYIKNINKTKRRNIIIIASILAVIIIGVFLFIGTFPKKEMPVMVDPIQKDLIEYLKQIKVQRVAIAATDSAKNYDRNVNGILDENDERVILAKMGLQEIPDPTKDQDGYNKYWKEWGNKSEQILKSKSIKETFKISGDYYDTEANYYSQITPVTNEVESIHKYLIRSKELAAKAYKNFLSGMSLGYISNVKDTKDGEMSWTFNIRSREYSDNYKNYLETSANESKAYFRMLEQLVVKYNLLKEYKIAYPVKGYIKERNLKKSQVQ